MHLPRHARMFAGQFDMAPFACVFFLVLMFLLLQTQLAPVPGVQVRLPKVSLVDDARAGDGLVVVVDKENRLYFEQQITTEEKLQSDLAAKREKLGGKVQVLFQADAEVQNRTLTRLFALCRRAGIDEIKLQTRPPVPDIAPVNAK